MPSRQNEEKEKRNVYSGITEGSTKLIDLKEHHYIDRSNFIKKILDSPSIATLITRPRRFMKTSNLQLLADYLSIATAPMIQSLFKDLEISTLKDELGRSYSERHFGKYPVIFLSFRDVNGTSFQEVYREIKQLMRNLYNDYLESFFDSLSVLSKNSIIPITDGTANIEEYSRSLFRLTKILKTQYGSDVWILLDEYDHCFTALYRSGKPEDINELMKFMKTFLTSAIKDNQYLKKAVLAGITPISTADLFSGFNNLKVSSLLDPAEFGDCFGFVEKEVQYLLNKTQSKLTLDILRQWYNGYVIGNTVVYNPWSIIKALNSQECKLYWTKTTMIAEIEDIVANLYQKETKKLWDLVCHPRSIEIALYDSFSYTADKFQIDSLYELLWHTGYLRLESRTSYGVKHQCKVSLANEEVYLYFAETIWLKLINPQEGSKENAWTRCLNSLVSDPPNIEAFVEHLQKDRHKQAECFSRKQKLCL